MDMYEKINVLLEDQKSIEEYVVSRTKITLEELLTLQQATKTVKVPKDIVNKFIRLINDLDRQAIHVSDRRQNECFKIMQGSAVTYMLKLYFDKS